MGGNTKVYYAPFDAEGRHFPSNNVRIDGMAHIDAERVLERGQFDNRLKVVYGAVFARSRAGGSFGILHFAGRTRPDGPARLGMEAVFRDGPLGRA